MALTNQRYAELCGRGTGIPMDGAARITNRIEAPLYSNDRPIDAETDDQDQALDAAPLRKTSLPVIGPNSVRLLISYLYERNFCWSPLPQGIVSRFTKEMPDASPIPRS